MHGVKRTTNTAPEEAIHQEEQDCLQIELYKNLTNQLLEIRLNAAAFSEPSTILECTKKLLLLNPDFLTAWNMRKEALLKCFQIESINAELVKNELEFGVAAIKCNPKSYGAWYHRKWIMSHLKSLKIPIEVSHELKLCNKLLEIDSRNFHCWNYRWFLTENYDVDIQSEFDFTTLMIYKNFSNYSAWHRRSILLPKLETKIGFDSVTNIIQSDLKIIKSAYFTEPKDQSCWFYLRWLLSFASSRKPAEKNELLQTELKSIAELLSIEPDCALALNAYVFIAKQLNLDVSDKLAHLKIVDPLRKGMYDDATNLYI